MDSDDPASEQFRKNLILASALFHTRAPQDQVYANCSRVLRHALIAAGLWDDHLREGQWEAFHGEIANFPAVALWYSTLIELTRHEPKSERLLNGQGNFVLPAGAYFTACWLTPAGRVVAERLLAENPEWAKSLNTPDE